MRSRPPPAPSALSRARSPGDTCHLHYTGKLLDGTVFDSSVRRGTPFTFTLGERSVIAGWESVVPTMKVGEAAVATISAELGYGAAGSPPAIPPNATLVFELELLAAAPKPKELWQMTPAERLAGAEAA